MPTSFDDDPNNEQLVSGAVENALAQLEGDLSFPENFPTHPDAAAHNDEDTELPPEEGGELHHHEQYSQEPTQLDPALYAAAEQHYAVGGVHMNTRPSKKSKKQKNPINCGRWTEAEHYAFLQGVAQHGKDCTKIAAMIPSRTTLQVRTHAQKYFQKLEKGPPTIEISTDEAMAQMPENQPVVQQQGITSPIAAQTLLGMAQLAPNAQDEYQPQEQQQQQQRRTKRKLNMDSKKPKKPHQCKFKECKAQVVKGTQACLKHQPFLCTYPYCADFVEVDNRFSQKRELCRIHYMELTNRTRSLYPGRSDRP